jgi:hypothetical protein
MFKVDPVVQTRISVGELIISINALTSQLRNISCMSITLLVFHTNDGNVNFSTEDEESAIILAGGIAAKFSMKG